MFPVVCTFKKLSLICCIKLNWNRFLHVVLPNSLIRVLFLPVQEMLCFGVISVTKYRMGSEKQ